MQIAREFRGHIPDTSTDRVREILRGHEGPLEYWLSLAGYRKAEGGWTKSDARIVHESGSSHERLYERGSHHRDAYHGRRQKKIP